MLLKKLDKNCHLFLIFDGKQYFEYEILVYVDDVFISANQHERMNALAKLYQLKEDPSYPSKYLGGVCCHPINLRKKPSVLFSWN